MSLNKVIVVAVIILLIVAWFVFDLGKYLNFATLKENQQYIQGLVAENFWLMAGGFFALYIVITALSIPGAAIMTVASGVLFGLWSGTILASFASSLGATLAFLGARFLLRDAVLNKFGDKLQAIDQGIAKDGLFYLFTLRLIPLIPFFVINLLLGITHMKTLNFYGVSQLGMLPGTIVYVNAGTQLSNIASPADILSIEVLASFALLGLLPLVSKKVIELLRRGRNAKI